MGHSKGKNMKPRTLTAAYDPVSGVYSAALCGEKGTEATVITTAQGEILTTNNNKAAMKHQQRAIDRYLLPQSAYGHRLGTVVRRLQNRLKERKGDEYHQRPQQIGSRWSVMTKEQADVSKTILDFFKAG